MKRAKVKWVYVDFKGQPTWGFYDEFYTYAITVQFGKGFICSLKRHKVPGVHPIGHAPSILEAKLLCEAKYRELSGVKQ